MSGAPGAAGPTVLVAETSRTLATLIRLTLQADGYQPLWVSSGREAINEARRNAPALAIVDAALHDLDGYDLADALRAHEPTQHVPILLLHHDYDVLDAERVRRARVSDVMAKPFERQALLSRVRALAPHSGNAVEAGVRPADQARIDKLADHRPPTPDPRSIFDRTPQPNPGVAHVGLDMRGSRPTASTAAIHAPVAEPAAQGPRPPDNALPFHMGAPPTVPPGVVAATATIPVSINAHVRTAIDSAVADAMESLGPRLERLLDEHLQQALDTEVRQLVKSKAETIVWKTVGELTEDLIREEIRRLTSHDP